MASGSGSGPGRRRALRALRRRVRGRLGAGPTKAANGSPDLASKSARAHQLRFLEKAGDSTRGGRRAYYRCTDRQTIARLLAQLTPVQAQGERPPDPHRARFGFIGAGNSGEPGSDTARRAGDISYQPRSWR